MKLLTGRIENFREGSGWVYDGKKAIEFLGFRELVKFLLKITEKTEFFVSDASGNVLENIIMELNSTGVKPNIRANREQIFSIQLKNVEIRSFSSLFPGGIKSARLFSPKKGKHEFLHGVIRKIESLFPSARGGTIGGTAFNFLKHYLDMIDLPHKKSNLPLLKALRPAYYGGRNEIFKRRLDTGETWDINSSYLHSMTKPMPVGKPVIIKKNFNLNLGGIVCATVTVPDSQYFGTLPYRLSMGNKLDRLFFPVGKWTGLFTVPELKFFNENSNLEINKIWYQIQYPEEKPFLKEFAVMLWNYRQNAKNNAERGYFKLLGNSIAGKYAQHYLTETVYQGDPQQGCFSLPIQGYYLKPMVSIPSSADYAVGAYITSYARIELYKNLVASHDPAYCDTDSVWAVDFPDDNKSSDLGKWSCEHRFNNLMVAGGKMYAYQENGKWKQTKHFKTINEFIDLYNRNRELTDYEKRLLLITNNREWIEGLSFPFSVTTIRKAFSQWQHLI